MEIKNKTKLMPPSIQVIELEEKDIIITNSDMYPDPVDPGSSSIPLDD